MPYSDIYFLNICYTFNLWEHMPKHKLKKLNEIFLKKYILVKTFSSDN